MPWTSLDAIVNPCLRILPEDRSSLEEVWTSNNLVNNIKIDQLAQKRRRDGNSYGWNG